MKELQEYKLTPRRLVIDLIRIRENAPMPVKAIIAAGEIFAFKASAIRVTITRLVREGLLESDDRGVYRLTESTSPLTHFVNTWREGEKRVKPWDETWILAHLPKNPNRNDRKRSLKALDFMGFREGLDGIWVRPNNLTKDVSEVKSWLSALRLEKTANVFHADELDPNLTDYWCRNLWPVESYQQNYQTSVKSLKKSSETVRKLSFEEALLETFITGSKAIHTLAIDPLLPEKIMPNEYRKELWETMLEYDKFGRTFWARFPEVYLDITTEPKPPILRSVK